MSIQFYSYTAPSRKQTSIWVLSLWAIFLLMGFQAQAQSLTFGTTTANQSSVTNGTVAPFSNTLRTSTGTAATVTLSKPGGQTWLILPTNPTGVGTAGTPLSFEIDPTGLAQGVYTATVQASAAGYTNGTFTVVLRVAAADAAGTTEVKVNFREDGTATPPAGWIFAENSSYGVRNEANQGNGQYSFGWVGSTPPNGINRTNSCSSVSLEQATFIYMHNPGATPQVFRTWEIAVPDGLYEVTVSAGDATDTQNMIHNINVEGSNAISLFGGTGSLPACSPDRFKVGTTTVFVGDGRLTIDPFGGNSSRINYAIIKPATARLQVSPLALQVNAAFGDTPPSATLNVGANFGNPSQISLSKSADSDWLILPTNPVVGDNILNFDLTGLVIGNYQAVVTVSSPGYEDVVLFVNLTVLPRTMTFNPEQIDLNTFYNQAVATQQATITGNFETPLPTVTLTKTAGASWIELPLNPEVNVPLDFAIDPTGLPPGLHTATITASAEGYQNATLVFNLTVAPFGLNFTQNQLTFNVTQGQSAASQVNTLNADNGTPAVLLTKQTGSAWLNLPTAGLGSLNFGIDAGGLPPGTYETEVIASAPGYTSAKMQVQLVVAPNLTNITWGTSVNFIRTNVSPFTQPSGFVTDNGSAYGGNPARGWINPATDTPLSNQRYLNSGVDNAWSDDEKLNRTWNYLNNPINGFYKWEMALANGVYNVLISVGDLSDTTGIHRVTVEGTNAINDFIPTTTNRQKLGFVTVEVTDGRLTLDAGEGGSFTKLNYIRTALANPANDVVPPNIVLTFNGQTQNVAKQDTYNDQVLVEAEASDAGGSGLASFEFSINGGPFQNYTNGLLINEIGNYTIQLRATDGQGNISVSPLTPFKVVRPVRSNAKLGLYNLDRFPANDNLTFSLIQNPFQNIGPNFAASHNKVVLRIRNTGSANLRINDLVISEPTYWRIETLGGSLYNPSAILPITIAPGQFIDAVVEFTANFPVGATPAHFRQDRVGVLHETLTIVSNDDEEPRKTVFLHGLWQRNGEGSNEPNFNEIIDALGLKTASGFSPNKPGNNAAGYLPTGDEVFSANWQRADLTRPVYVRQVAAYHGCCNSGANIKYNKPGVKGGATIVGHIGPDGQSLLPRSSLNGNPAERSFVPAANFTSPEGLFNFTLVNDATDASLNMNGWVGVRIYKARDPKGNIIPNAYLMTMDYLSNVANWDYNDNVFYIENIRPATGTAFVSVLGTNLEEILYPNTQVEDFQTVQIDLTNLGQTFASGPADPNITIGRIALAGDDLEDFAFSPPTTRTLSATQSTNMTVSFSPKTAGAKKAELLIFYNAGNTELNTYSPVRIPLYGIAETSCATLDLVKRIKSAVPNANPVLIGGETWESDVTYRKGSIKLDVSTPPIRNTGRDELYSTYLSSTTDLRGIQYQIPLAPGQYKVRLHFAENFFDRVGSRINNILIENVLRLPGYDIYEDVKFKTATSKDFDVTLADGLLDINFVPIQNRPAICGIEIFRFTENINALNLSLQSSTLANCSAADGSLTVAATGAPNIEYKLGEFGVYQSSGTFNNLASGEYVLYARDTDGNCEVSEVYVLDQASNSVDFSLELNPVSCNSNNDGRARITITGGQAPYTIIWNNNPELTTPIITNLPVANNHTVTVTDANGCTKTEVFSIGTTPGCPLRINSGGGVFISSTGRQFIPDQFFSGGSTSATATPVTGTQEPNLYATSRFGGTVRYNIPVANGTYAVVLYFAETSTTVTNIGQRIFNVDIEGVRRLSDYDLVEQVGPFNALTETLNVTVNDNTLNILLTGVVGNAVISGLELIPINVSNVAPIVNNTLPDRLVPLNAPFSFTFAANTFSDPGDLLTFMATQQDNSALPSWITFDPATRTFSTFANVAAGTEVDVKLTAIDSYGQTVSQTFKITAGNVSVVNSVNLKINTRPMRPGANRVMLAVEVDAGTSTNLEATQFDFTTLGTSNLASLSAARLYYTGTLNQFRPTNPFGSAVNNPNGAFVFNGTRTLAAGINYFWLVYEVNNSTQTSDLFGAEFVNAEVGGNDYAALNAEVLRTVANTATRSGNAYDFQGLNNFLRLEGDVAWSEQLTLESWLSTQENPSTEKWLIGEENGTRLVQLGNQILFYVYADGALRGPATATIPNFGNADVPWHHVAAVYDGNALQVYINGKAGTAFNYIGTNTQLGNAIQLGATNPSNQSNVLLDEVRIWNRALSLNEIRRQMHLTLTGTENGLRHYLQFEEDENNTEVYDLVGDTYALRTNPTLTNWVEALEPVGLGVSQAFTVNTAGAVNFNTPGVLINFGAVNPQGEVVVTRLFDADPYERPSEILNEIEPGVNDGRPKSTDYWIINNFGTNNGNLTPLTMRFTIDEALFNAGISPSSFTLFSRPSNFVGLWQDGRNGTASGGQPGERYVEFTGTRGFSQFVITVGGDSPLPVSLLSFEGVRQDAQTVRLEWKTASEKDNLGFEIEKSEDGLQFNTIGFVEGAGTSNLIQNYTFWDNQANGSAYYRLKQLDFGGTFSYSEVVFVRGEGVWMIYPNPASTWVKIQAEEEARNLSNLQLELSDMRGQVLSRQVGTLNHLEEALNALLPQLTQGVYVCRIKNGNQMQTFKLIKGQ